MPWDIKEIFRRYCARDSLSTKQRLKCLEEDVEDLRRRLERLEKVADESVKPLDVSSVRPETRVRAWHPEKGWIDAYFWENCCGAAFVRAVDDHTGLGFFWTNRIAEAEDA